MFDSNVIHLLLTIDWSLCFWSLFWVDHRLVCNYSAWGLVKYWEFMTSNVIKHLHCFYVQLLIKAANYFVWPFATNTSFECPWDQKASSETEIKRIYLQLVESASFMIYKLLISNQSLILLLVHLRLHRVLIIPRLDIKMGIVSYFLFIGYNINLHMCMNAYAHTLSIYEKVMLDYVITGNIQCIKLIQVLYIIFEKCSSTEHDHTSQWICSWLCPDFAAFGWIKKSLGILC